MKRQAAISLGYALAFFALLEASVRAYTSFHVVFDIEMTKYTNELKIDAMSSRIGHLHEPSKTARLMGVEVRTNSAGFRDREYTLERNRKKRIIFLGDSLTFGWGVNKEDTFEERLERGSTPPVEILNFGHGNYNTDQEVGLFLDKGLPLKPDTVVLFYFINDAEETPRKNSTGWLSHSQFLTLAWGRFKSFNARISGSSYRNYYSDLYSNSSAGFAAAKRALQQLRDVCRERKIALKVVLLPELHDVAQYPFQKEHAKVTAVLKNLGVPFLDLTPKFASIGDPRLLWVSPDDAHPNAEAHKLIAELARDFVLTTP